MNIFGRVFGGFLVLISLGWLATAGIRPGNNSNNQINSNPPESNVAAPAKVTSGAAPATTSTAKTSTFNAGAANTGAANTGAANTGVAGTVKPEVEKNPRAATTPSKADTAKAPAQPTAPAAAPPVAAGW
ncbi:MAG: hypothetical protein NT070_03245 [Cyanobacteria bacterium]|nr:hypothetical protein [Cyanobacteriota bacterium]